MLPDERVKGPVQGETETVPDVTTRRDCRTAEKRPGVVEVGGLSGAAVLFQSHGVYGKIKAHHEEVRMAALAQIQLIAIYGRNDMPCETE